MYLFSLPEVKENNLSFVKQNNSQDLLMVFFFGAKGREMAPVTIVSFCRTQLL